MSTLGWFHTAMGVIALLSGIITLYKHKEITSQSISGQIYLLATLVTAATALAIYQQGSFGPGHILAVLTLGALTLGTVAGYSDIFGKISRSIRAVSYTATLLFHSIPAVTDGLLRLPVGDPILTSIEDPILLMCYAALLLLYVVGVTWQLRWIRRQHPLG
jgi:uncharacterized membrane protein